MKRSTRKIALSAMLTALSMVLLTASSVMPTGRIVLAALSGVPVLIMAVVGGGGYGLGVYVITALLGLLFLPGKAMAVAYATLFGAYPVVQFWVESRQRLGRWIKIGIKFVSFVILMALLGGCAVAFFDVGQYAPVNNLALVGGGSILLFFVYDKGLILVVHMLYQRMKPLFDKVMGRKGNGL